MQESKKIIPMNIDAAQFWLKRWSYVLLQLLLATFFLGFAFISLIFPYSGRWTFLLLEFIFENPIWMTLLGILSLGIALLIFQSAISNAKHRAVSIRTGPLSVVMNEKVIRTYMDQYWKKKFPESPVSFQINFKKKKIVISAHLPNASIEKKQIQEDLVEIFGRLLGYPHEVELVAYSHS